MITIIIQDTGISQQFSLMATMSFNFIKITHYTTQNSTN